LWGLMPGTSPKVSPAVIHVHHGDSQMVQGVAWPGLAAGQPGCIPGRAAAGFAGRDVGEVPLWRPGHPGKLA